MPVASKRVNRRSASAPIIPAFLKALESSGGFLCLECAGARIGASAERLVEQVLLAETWTGYSFASGTCTDCGSHRHCAIGTGQPAMQRA